MTKPIVIKVMTDPWLIAAAIAWIVTALLSSISGNNMETIRQATIAMCDVYPTINAIAQISNHPNSSTASDIASAICVRAAVEEKP